MVRDDECSRRTVLTLAGVASTAAVAGCLGDDDDEPVNVEAWEGVTEIRLEGQMSHWTGVAPEQIDDVENPRLVLFAGETYELTWENADGYPHNIEFQDDDGTIIEGTDTMAETGETQTLEFEATEEMVTYVCNPHRSSMVGDVVVRSD